MRVQTKLQVTFDDELQTEVYREDDATLYVKIKQGDDYVWIPADQFTEFLRVLTEWNAK